MWLLLIMFANRKRNTITNRQKWKQKKTKSQQVRELMKPRDLFAMPGNSKLFVYAIRFFLYANIAEILIVLLEAIFQA